MRRAWIPVHGSVWTTPSHAKLRGIAYLLTPFLAYLADGDPTWRENGRGRLVGPDGNTPLTFAEIADLARTSVKSCEKCIQSLIKVGTLEIDADGCVYFPNYREYQPKSAWADKVGTELAHQISSTKRREEKRRDIGELSSSPTARTSPTDKKRGGAAWLERSQGLTSDELTVQVLTWIAAARRSGGISSRTPPVTSTRRDMACKPIDQGHTLEDWWTVIERQRISTLKQGGDALKRWLKLSTMCVVAKTFAYRLDEDHVAVAPMPPVGAEASQSASESIPIDFYPQLRQTLGGWQWRPSEGMWVDCSEDEAEAIKQERQGKWSTRKS